MTGESGESILSRADFPWHRGGLRVFSMGPGLRRGDAVGGVRSESGWWVTLEGELDECGSRH